MLLRFTKMHGLGNDFVVVDLLTQRYRFSADLVRQLGDRHRGIGFDQLLLIDVPQKPEADFRYRIFNCDGNEVEQCGNGARCFVKYVRDKQLTGKRRITVETAGGLIEMRVTRSNQYCVDMGVPVLEPDSIPFQAEAEAAQYPLVVDGEEFTIGAVSMGNPHAVLTVDDVASANVEGLGAAVECHPSFPNRVNVGFMEIVDRGHIKLRVFERGVGETQACGTGACAAVVAGRLADQLDRRVRVELPGGVLHIDWPGKGKALEMTGPAETVYEGKIKLGTDKDRARD